MFNVELAPLGGILGPLKSDLGVFWAKIPLSSDWFYNVKTQKAQFLQNRAWEIAEIENIHCPICTQPIPSSWQNALPPALATSVQRGDPNTLNWVTTFIWKEGQRPSESVSTLCKICLHFCLFLLAGKSCQVLAGIVAGKSLGHRWHDLRTVSSPPI